MHGDHFDRDFLMALTHEFYKTALLQDEISKALYIDFKNKVNPREDVQFSFQDVIYFVISAATAGITGNLIYDSLKKLFKRIDKKRGTELIEQD